MMILCIVIIYIFYHFKWSFYTFHHAMYIFKTESISKLSNNLIFSGQNLVPEWFKYRIFFYIFQGL